MRKIIQEMENGEICKQKKNSSFTKQIMKKKYVEKSKQQGSDSVTEYFLYFFILFMLSSAFTINCSWVWDCIWLDPHCNVNWRFSHFHTSFLFRTYYTAKMLSCVHGKILLKERERENGYVNWPLSKHWAAATEGEAWHGKFTRDMSWY